jgi:hypothetical protein
LRFKPALQAPEMLHIVGDDDLCPDKHPNSGNVAVFSLVRPGARAAQPRRRAHHRRSPDRPCSA